MANDFLFSVVIMARIEVYYLYLCMKERYSLRLLGNNGVDAGVLALVDTVFNKDVTVLEANSDVGGEVVGSEQGWVAALLHKQLEHIIAVADNVLVVLENDLDRLLEDTVLGHNLDTAQALELELGALKAVVLGSKGVELLDGDTCRVQNVVVLGGGNGGDVGLAARDQGTVTVGHGGVDQVKDGLDILEVDVQSNPVGEQGSSL